MSLPISQLGDTYNEDVRAFLRNNVSDVAQVLKGELIPQIFERNVKFALTTDKRFKEGKTYYTRRSTPSMDAKDTSKRVWRYDLAETKTGAVVPGELIPEGTYYEMSSDEVVIGGYPTYTLPRGYNDIVSDTVFDTKWFDSIGMYKMPLYNTYPNLQGYNVFATPLVLEGLASYLAKMNWRLRLLIDGSLSTLIDKFVITKDPLTEKAEYNGTYHLYFQTSDTNFQAGKTYYRRSKAGYYTTSVTVGEYVRTQTGYERPTETKYLDFRKYYRRSIDTTTLSGYKYTLLVKGKNYDVGDDIVGEDIYAAVYNGYNNYYERTDIPYPDYYLREVEDDSTTPESNRYFAPITSGDPVVENQDYYYYDAKTNDFIKCSKHPTEGYQYYTFEPVEVFAVTTDKCFRATTTYYSKLASSPTYTTLKLGEDYQVSASIATYCEEHGTLSDPCTVYEKVTTNNYKALDLDLPENQLPDSFDGRAIYRMEFGEYYCVGQGTGCSCLFIGKTKNNVYEAEEWKDSQLYRQLTANEYLQITDKGAIRRLYIDPTDEDICRIKDMVNIFLTKYRTILLSTRRKAVSYAPIKGDAVYTTADLIDRINAITSSMNTYSEETATGSLGYRDATGKVYNADTEYYVSSGSSNYTLILDHDLIKRVTVDEVEYIAPASEQEFLNNGTVYIEPSIEPLGYRDATDETYNKYTDYYVRAGFNNYVLINDHDLIKRVTVDDEERIAPASEQTSLGNVPVYIEAYTARDMKLKINQIIDYIVNESYYFNLFKEDFGYNLLKFEDNFWTHRGMSKMLYDMATTSDEPPTARNYNDRWFYYDRSLSYIDDTYAKLNLTDMFVATETTYTSGKTYYKYDKEQRAYVKLVEGTDYNVGDEIQSGAGYLNRNDNSAGTISDVVGNIKLDAVDTEAVPALYGGYSVCVLSNSALQWVPLCHVANVYNIADVWSNCNYSGCMQALNLTLHMLESCTPERVSWKEGIHNPRKSVTTEFKAVMEGVLDQIEDMADRISLLLDYAPHVADIVVDIGYHVTTQFKMTMEDTIPVREEAPSFISGKVYSYYSAGEKKYLGVKINTATEFAAQKLIHGTLFTWNFYHKKK